MKHQMKTLLTVGVMLAATASSADLSTDTVRDVSIESASMIFSEDRDARLMFTVSNDPPETIRVMGVSFSLAQAGEIIGESHHGEEFSVSGLVLEPDEELDFTTSHLEVRLSGVTKPEGLLVFEVMLSDGAVTGQAHVH